MNKLKKNKSKKTIIILFLIISLIFFSTVVYSSFSSTMNITGNAQARIEANVRITDFRLESTNNATSSYEEFGKNHIVSNIELKSSSSSITYYLEITNYGSIDVGILNITGLPNGVNYSIKDYNLTDKICNDSGKCNSFITKTYELTLTTSSTYVGSIKMNFDFRTYHKVTYTDITNNNYPTEVIDGGNITIAFKENLKRVAFISNNQEIKYYSSIANNQTITLNNITNDVEVKIKDPVAILKKGNLNTIGSEVCIGNECFHIISNDGSTVTMLAKYNLYVGYECLDSSEDSCTLYGDEATGLQNSNMIGYGANGITRRGTLRFSPNTYWTESISTYPAYVYNSNSSLYPYVENYSNYLKSAGLHIKTSRLITKEELEALGCTMSNSSCGEAPSWVYTTTYWSGTATANEQIVIVTSIAGFSDSNSYAHATSRGIRPVIEIDVEEILVPTARLINGSLDEVGSEICIENECFYTISSNKDNITMLAKYNLHIGMECQDVTISACVSYGSSATGLQDSTMKGYAPPNPRTGVIEFSKTNYWTNSITEYPAYVYNENSSLYQYVENYKDYLTSINTIIKDARLITKDELTSLGCNYNQQICSTSTYPWTYSTTYWTGTATSDYKIVLVTTDAAFYDNHQHAYEFSRGIRPVITIPKKIIRDTIDINIDGTIYKAEEGMTWGEWVNSKYNTNQNISIVGTEIYANNMYPLHTKDDGSYHYAISDYINPSIIYSFTATSGGSGN